MKRKEGLTLKENSRLCSQYMCWLHNNVQSLLCSEYFLSSANNARGCPVPWIDGKNADTHLPLSCNHTAQWIHSQKKKQQKSPDTSSKSDRFHTNWLQNTFETQQYNKNSSKQIAAACAEARGYLRRARSVGEALLRLLFWYAAISLQKNSKMSTPIRIMQAMCYLLMLITNHSHSFWQILESQNNLEALLFFVISEK